MTIGKDMKARRAQQIEKFLATPAMVKEIKAMKDPRAQVARRDMYTKEAWDAYARYDAENAERAKIGKELLPEKQERLVFDNSSVKTAYDVEVKRSEALEKERAADSAARGVYGLKEYD